MEIAAIDRSLGLAGVLMAAVLLAGCANTRGGYGGNRFGPADFTKSKDDGAGPYPYYFEQALPSGGGKTETAKYFLTVSGVDPADPRKARGFELDPVIIVDR